MITFDELESLIMRMIYTKAFELTEKKDSDQNIEEIFYVHQFV